jgi:uncharacterized RDD family membrane protein YckC/predicted component of type VI protein secretion system
MAKLIVNPTSPSRREVALSRSLLSIGRDPSNDVVLPDAMVSRRHAVIEYRGSQYFLRDCNSSNGSLINGDRVSERGLRDGDLVAIGTARLLFRDDLVAEDAAGKVIHHPSAPRQQCPSCHQDYRKGDVFCRHCGSSLAPHAPPRTVCTACGTAVPLPARFCTACGTRLGDDPGDATAPPSSVEELLAPPLSAGSLEEPTPREEDAPAAPPLPPEPEAQAAPEPSLPAFHLASTADELPLPALRGPALSPLPQRPAPAQRRPEELPAPLLAEPVRDVPLFEAPPAGPRTVLQLDEPTSQVPEAAAPAGRTVAAAGALPRLGAFVVDLVIVSVGQALLALPALMYWTRGAAAGADAPTFLPIFLSVTLAALAVILTAVYHVYFWGVKAATPGKRLFRLEVQGQDGRLPIGPGRAALRLLGYVVSGVVFGIGFLMIAFGGGGLHDQIAGTRVVRRQGD